MNQKFFKKSLLIGSVFALMSCSTSSQMSKNDIPVGDFGPKRHMVDGISKAELKHHLTFLSSDEFRGRDTGSPQLKIAAKYLANLLESYGYKGLGENGSFFQNMPIYMPEYDHQGLTLSYNGKDLNMKYGKDFAVYGYGGTDDYFIEAPLINVGYAIKNDDSPTYKSSDVKDKIAVRFAAEGKLWEKNKKKRQFHQGQRNRLYDNGAKSVLLVIDDNERADQVIKRYVDIASRNAAPTIRKEESPRTYVILKRSVFDQILKIEKKRRFKKSNVYNFKSKLSISLKSKAEKNTFTRNVVAYIEGTDPILKNEYVGFGAHYDHTGVNPDGSINNGANDDGSGTVSVLSIAKTIAKNPPKRSTMIIFHTGEEKGLWGSNYFTENPLVPLRDIVAVINMDMVGSNHQPERIYVVGADRISQELHDINEYANSQLDSIVLDYEWNERFHPEMIYYRSDHYNYAKHGIPIIFYSDKDPENYHKASDTIEKINFTKLRNVTRLALSTGYTVANQPRRLKITNPVTLPKFRPEFAKVYTGDYQMSVLGKLTILYEDELMYASIRGAEPRMLEHIEGETFSARGIKMVFDKNNSSEAQFLTVSVMGRTFKGAKDGFKLPEKKSASVSEADLKKLVGKYKTDGRGMTLTFSIKNGKLCVSDGNRFSDQPLKAISATKFAFDLMGAELNFLIKDGKANKIEMSVGGQVRGTAVRL